MSRMVPLLLVEQHRQRSRVHPGHGYKGPDAEYQQRAHDEQQPLPQFGEPAHTGESAGCVPLPGHLFLYLSARGLDCLARTRGGAQALDRHRLLNLAGKYDLCPFDRVRNDIGILKCLEVYNL